MERLTEEQLNVITALSAKLKNLAVEIKAISDQGTSIADDPSQLFLFKGMCRELKSYFDSLNDTWDKLVEDGISLKVKDNIPSDVDKKQAQAAKKYYYRACAIYESHMNPTPVAAPSPVAQSPAGPSRNNSTMNESRTVRARLPQINLPTFSGEQTEWPLFRDTFKSLIHDETSLSPIEKFHFLISCLRGPALSLIKAVPLQEANYEQAWKILKENFDNKRRLATQYLKMVLSFAPFKNKPTANNLKYLLTTVVESVNAFNQLTIENADDFIFTYLVLRCLDPLTRKEFEREVAGDEMPTFDQLVEFLKAEWRSLDFTTEDSRHQTHRSSLPFTPKTNAGKKLETSFFAEEDSHPTWRQQPQHFKNNNKSSSKAAECPVCKSQHTLYNCKTFKSLSPADKVAQLKNWHGCVNCLSGKHNVDKCTSGRSCPKCNKKHHSWLHVTSSAASEETDPLPAGNALSGTSRSGQVILGTAIAKIKDFKGNYQKIRLVTDCGSQHSFITKHCVERLGLSVHSEAPNIAGIGQTQLSESYGMLTCNLGSRFQGDYFSTDAIVVQDITGRLPHTQLPYELYTYLSAYELADPQYWKPQEIDFLLGADLYYDLIIGAPITLREDLPKLVPSKLGYIVAGKCHSLARETSPGDVSLFVRNKEDMSHIMNKFWEIEDLPPASFRSTEEVACENHFKSTHYRLPSGRYVVALPFKSSIDDLVSPHQQVMNRFMNLECKLSRRPELKDEYCAFMDEYLKLNHMQPATEPSKYLIPHHCVMKTENGNTKIRVVFDASCKGLKGSLNDYQLVGPKLQRDITDIILSFRTFKVVLVADIIKMYRQVLVRPEDRAYQHILWRSNPNEEVKVMELNTVTNGQASASFLAVRALLQLVEDEGHRYPLAAKVLQESVLVDDIVAGAPTLEEGIQLQRELILLLKLGQFELSKWKSNAPELLKMVSNEDSNEILSISGQDDIGTKILGLQWFPSEDMFSFEVEKVTAPHTKRGILSTIARIYDPLGFLAPVVFRAKVILQDVWLHKCDWDQRVPQDIDIIWSSFAKELDALSRVKIPRFICCNDSIHYDLVGFSDASERGYAAVLYLRVSTLSGTNMFLVKAKTKLAPTKRMTIPRLELSGALLLARLIGSCKPPLSNIEISHIYLFTDSTIVLGWLKWPLNKLKVFVAHRISEILELTDVSSWQHISSEMNPADCASRGLMPQDLEGHKLWWSGPDWILDSPDTWPVGNFNTSKIVLPETKPDNTTVLIAEESTTFVLFMSQFSSYLRLIRVMVYVLRFVNRTRHKVKGAMSLITLQEMDEARLICIKLVQEHYLLKNKALVSSSLFKSLSSFIDDRGLVRVGGRLEHANVSYSVKHPIILPNCHFTRILIDHYHRSHLHIGASSLLAVLQNRYFIISARQIIRARVRSCVTCQRISPKSQPPLMGNLPAFRLEEGQIFQHVGVDLGGPFLIKESSRRKAALGKAYLCLFICMVTKAVHLEVVSGCSTDTFMAALHRFVSRRGKPRHIYSDCGTNFVGAASVLKELKTWYEAQQTQEKICHCLADFGIEWHFNPPRAPHFGGIWEAGIKSAKKLLFKNIGNTPLTFEEMSTLFSRIEAVLNSRPLCPVSNDADAVDCLTPGHFLIGRPLTALPEEALLDAKENTLKRWQLIQHRVQHFWAKWRSSYLNQLQQRKKWTSSRPNINEGDLVIINDPSCPVARWPLARVVSTHPGTDGVTRVATVRTPSGVYKRPVAKLVPLLMPSHED